MNNIIILTPGLSGSSLLASLLVKAGYWQGDETCKKSDYDTFENQDLVAINRHLLAQLNIGERYQKAFDNEWIARIKARETKFDLTPLKQFYAQCELQSAWLWKDPRLWLTLDLWQEIIDLSQVKFILLHREELQLWVSCLKRRQIQSLSFCKRYNQQVCNTIRQQVVGLGGELLEVCFEDLLMQPESAIDSLNQFLDTHLTLDDLKSVYKGELYKKNHNGIDHLQAALIYFKNYSQRYK